MATSKYDITDLLSSKSFEELTATEQSFAINELGSETAYREMYEVVQGTADYEAPKMTASKRDKTFAAFDELHAEEPNKKKGAIWFRPLVISLAAASIIGFVWLIGFSDLGKNQTLAENKSPLEKEMADSIVEKESVESKQELENEKNEAEPASAVAKEEETFDQEDLSTKIKPVIREQKVLIAEENDFPKPTVAMDEDQSVNESVAYTKNNTHTELTEDEKRLSDVVIDSDVALEELEIAQSNTVLEAQVVNETGSKRASKSAINMNSNISKPSIFKLTLPLRNHYTSY